MNTIIYITIIDRNAVRHLHTVNPLIMSSLSDLVKEVEPWGQCECRKGRGKHCHIEILSGIEKLIPPEDWEMDQLLRSPNYNKRSRLACQVLINSKMNGLILALA